MRALHDRGALTVARAALIGAVACAVVAAGVAVTVRDGDSPVTPSPSPSASATPSVLSATATGHARFPSAPHGYAPLGARMTVTVRPAPTGETTEVVVRVTDNDGYLESILVDYGDGGRRDENPPRISDSGLCVTHPPAPSHNREPSDETKTFRHVYRASGAHTIRVTAETAKGTCHPLTFRLRETSVALVPLAVSQG